MARRATITTSSPAWLSASASVKNSPRAVRPGSGFEYLYASTCRGLAGARRRAPEFDKFWEAGELLLPTVPWDGGIVRAFRRDPNAAPLPTPSGKVEIASSAIASFGYEDCPGASDLAAAARRRRLAGHGALSASARRQPAGNPIA